MLEQTTVDLSSSDGIDIRLIAVPMIYVEVYTQDETTDDFTNDYYRCSICKRKMDKLKENDYKEKPHNLHECLIFLLSEK